MKSIRGKNVPNKCLGHLNLCLVQRTDVLSIRSKALNPLYVKKKKSTYTRRLDDTTTPNRPTTRGSETNMH